jgi:hypothetical protein
MALVSIAPIEAHVAWDHHRGAPRRVRFGDREVRVSRLTSVRDERAAYPAGTAPRLTLVVETEDGEAMELVFDARHRRWFVDALDTAA